MSISALAQQPGSMLIDVDFKKAGITQIVTDLQTKTGYHFYYDPAQFDSLRVSVQVSQKTLAVVLNKIFENTAFHYAITTQNEVILTKGREIRTTLPDGFLTISKAQPQKPKLCRISETMPISKKHR